MEVYLYNEGLQKLSKEVKGTERIHIGIRPYGFHAGNALATVVYPIMLCELVTSLGKKAEFTFIISINDYEQDYLTGPDYHRFPFNIHPKDTIIKYVIEPKEGIPVADYWLPIITKSIGLIKERYPEVSIRFVKNSELKNEPYFKECLLKTIEKPMEQLAIYKKYSARETLDSPLVYANAVCPKCKSANGDTYFSDGKIHLRCNKCNSFFVDDYSNFDYWWYHKPMVIPRYSVFDVDIAMGGGDHFNEGDVIYRKKLIKLFGNKVKEPKYFFCPTLLATDSRKMSKSLNNDEFGKIEELLEFSRNNINHSFTATKDLLMKGMDEKEYSRYLESFRVWPDRESLLCHK